MAGMSASDVPVIAGGGGSILQGLGGIMGGMAARRAGKSERAAAQFQAAQLEQNAGQAVAASQRAAAEERRKASLAVSRALAVAAASGGGASDTTVQNVIANLDAEGAYRSMVALYEGQEKSRQLSMAAAGKRYEGELAAQGGRQKGSAMMFAGLGSAAIGGGSLYMKYGRNGPSGDSAVISDSFDTGNLA